jgi:hypothetical protein
MIMMRNGTALAAALCGLLALTVAAWADGPTAGCGAGGCSPAGCGPAGLQPAGCGPAGCPSCGQDGGKSVCKPGYYTRTVERHVFTERCEEYCPTCSIIGMLTGNCTCSKPKKRKYLVLHLKKTEYCCKRNELVHEPPCDHGCGCGAGHPAMSVSHEGPAAGIALPPAGAPVAPAMPPALPPAVTAPPPTPAGK